MSVETAEVERLKWRKIEVEDVGKITFVRDTPHAKTNHFIEQSRPYFPNAKLPTYFDSQCCNFLTFAKLFCFASFFGALAAAGASLLIPIFFFIGCLALFLDRLLPTRASESEISAHCHDTARHSESELHKQLL